MTRPTAERAFTLIELLIVVGIIAILVSILLPSIRLMRLAVRGVETQSELNQIEMACQAYYADFGAYPGPLSNPQVRGGGPYPTIAGLVGPNPEGFNPTPILTGTENLVLGLLGGLKIDPATPGQYVFDPAAVGRGALGLNPNKPKRYPVYLDASTGYLSKSGEFFRDDAGRRCLDTAVPEFVDQYNNPLPILYIRANVGCSETANGKYYGAAGLYTMYSAGQVVLPYNLDQARAYTLTQVFPVQAGNPSGPPPGGQCIGLPAGKYHGLRVAGVSGGGEVVPGTDYATTLSLNPANGYDGFSSGVALDGLEYLTNPQTKAAKAKDTYVLISAGRDRIYGTSDDITNVGSP